MHDKLSISSVIYQTNNVYINGMGIYKKGGKQLHRNRADNLMVDKCYARWSCHLVHYAIRKTQLYMCFIINTVSCKQQKWFKCPLKCYQFFWQRTEQMWTFGTMSQKMVLCHVYQALKWMHWIDHWTYCCDCMPWCSMFVRPSLIYLNVNITVFRWFRI